MKLGVIGGGQLGRMMALAATPLEVRFTFLDPSEDACAGDTGQLVLAAYNDAEGIKQLISQVDRVTFEFESVPAETVSLIASNLPVYPSAESLAITRDRWTEKNLFKSLSIETAPVARIDNQKQLEEAAKQFGLPAIVKTRTLGYDGKGQKLLKQPSDLKDTFAQLGEVPLIFEGFIEFDAEVSCIAARSVSGETRIYPLVENQHIQGMLYRSEPLASHPLQQKAKEYAKRIMDHLDYVGVLTIEFFVKGDQLIANEIAPRVHNSGHWTIEGSRCSQFENHVRAISDMPLGDTSLTGHCSMYNLIGNKPDTIKLLSLPGCHVHLYRKAPRPGRKIGHVTLTATTADQLKQLEKQIEPLINNDLG